MREVMTLSNGIQSETVGKVLALIGKDHDFSIQADPTDDKIKVFIQERGGINVTGPIFRQSSNIPSSVCVWFCTAENLTYCGYQFIKYLFGDLDTCAAYPSKGLELDSICEMLKLIPEDLVEAMASRIEMICARESGWSRSYVELMGALNYGIGGLPTADDEDNPEA